MAPIKLTYFDLTALGEPIRFLLKYGGTEFEDIRVNESEWAQLKPSTPLGQLPILEKDGKVAHQTTAICRYLAKQCKLNGKNDWEDLEIDATVETISDMRNKIGVYCYEKDPEVKKTKAGPLFKEVLPYYLGKLDEQAKKNNGYLATSSLTWADIYFVAMLPYLNNKTERDITADHPNLEAVKSNVLAVPTIKTWVETRPKTRF